MGLKGILIVLVAILMVGSIVAITVGAAFSFKTTWAGMSEEKRKEVQKQKKLSKLLIPVGVIVLILSIVGAIFGPASIHIVDTGEVAVVKYLGNAKKIRTAGTYFDLSLLYDYQTYDAKVQNLDIQTMTYSSDAQTMDIQMTIQYAIRSDKVMDIAKQYGSLETLQSRIQSIAIEKTKSVLSSHKAMDIIAKRAEISPVVAEAVKGAIGEEYFVTVNTVVLTNIDFSDAFEKAVEDKMIAEQQQLKADYENQTKVAKAEADAEAKRIAAQGEKDANDLLQKTLTEEILRQQFINKWNGQLPQYIDGDDAAGLIVDITGETTTKE